MNYNLTEDITIKGKWFINEDTKIHGELKFKPETRIELSLLGCFHTIQERWMGNPKERFIYGISEDGDEITLYRTILVDHSENFDANYVRCTFSVNMAFIGYHFKNEDFIFERFDFGLQNFGTWYGVTGLNVNDYTSDEYNVEYKKPIPVEFNISNNKCRFISSYTTALNENDDICLAEHSKIELESEGYTLDDIFKHVAKFKSILSLMTYEQTYLTSLSVFSNKIVYQDEIRNGKIKKINLLWRDISYYKSIKEKVKSDMLITFPDIKENLELVCCKWYEYYDSIRPSFNLLFYSFRKSLQFTEEFFMDMARAIEVWHRRNNSDCIRMYPNDFNNFVKRALSNNALDNDEKLLLKGALTYANEPKLEDRLTDVFNEAGFIFNLNEQEKDIFLKDVKNSRHYYTHYDPSKEKKAKKNLALHDLGIELRALLISAILLKVGMTKDLIKEKIHDVIFHY